MEGGTQQRGGDCKNVAEMDLLCLCYIFWDSELGIVTERLHMENCLSVYESANSISYIKI